MFSRKNDGKITRIIYTSDLHASDRTFMKFTNLIRKCKADVAIVGGDVTGKAIVPIIRQPDGTYSAYFQGLDQIAKNEGKVVELERNISTNGMYAYRTTKEEIDALDADKKKFSDLFAELMKERLIRWLRIIEERVKQVGARVYIMGGNDDDPVVDEVIRDSGFVVNPDGMVLNIDEDYEMISTGYGNITPWNCPRDIPEERLAEKIESMASKVTNMNSCIFNFHVPPINTLLDQCPKLDTSVYPPKPKLGEMTSGGSLAVRQAIEKYQPLLGLHGHIHESKGLDKIGRTTCFNPGSEYSEGILGGVMVNLSRGGMRSFQFISG